MYRRQFLTAATAAATGVVGVSSQVEASVPESAYTTEATCVRDGPGGAPVDMLNAYTGGYVVDGPVSDGGFTWQKLAFNEDGDSEFTHCMAEADGPVTGWVRSGLVASADFAYPVTGRVFHEWDEYGGNVLAVAADVGQSVYAAEDGTVVTAESGEDSPYGRHVVVDHGGGWTTLCGHLRDVLVSEGQPVTKGTEIGTVGSTGNASQPYAAFQIRRDGASLSVPGNRGRQLLGITGVPRSYR